MNDVRDRPRIKTLPSDLQEVANQMLQKKFKLAKQGEVVEENQAIPSNYSYMDNDGEYHDYIQYLTKHGFFPQGNEYGFTSVLQRLSYLMRPYTDTNRDFAILISNARYDSRSHIFDFKHRDINFLQDRGMRVDILTIESSPQRTAEQLYRDLIRPSKYGY